jgi:hypothetical protein
MTGKTHQAVGATPPNRHDCNRVHHRGYKPDPEELIIRKVPADSVPFGESLSRNGRTVWAAYRWQELIAVAATADDARRKYWEWINRTNQEAVRGKTSPIE